MAGQGGLHVPVQGGEALGEQLLLGAEVVVEGPGGDPRLLADVPHRHLVEAVLPGEDHGGLQNGLLGLPGLFLPALVIIHRNPSPPLDINGIHPL